MDGQRARESSVSGRLKNNPGGAACSRGQAAGAGVLRQANGEATESVSEVAAMLLPLVTVTVCAALDWPEWSPKIQASRAYGQYRRRHTRAR